MSVLKKTKNKNETLKKSKHFDGRKDLKAQLIQSFLHSTDLLSQQVIRMSNQ